VSIGNQRLYVKEIQTAKEGSNADIMFGVEGGILQHIPIVIKNVSIP
jgi:hypothetical protein